MRLTSIVAASFTAVAACAQSTQTSLNAPPPPTHHPQCPYSTEALKTGAEGAATIEVYITDEGKVSNVDVIQSSGTKALDDSAVSCAEKWRYKPATMNGKPIASEKMYQLKFTWGSGPKPNQPASSPVANPTGSQVR